MGCTGGGVFAGMSREARERDAEGLWACHAVAGLRCRQGDARNEQGAAADMPRGGILLGVAALHKEGKRVIAQALVAAQRSGHVLADVGNIVRDVRVHGRGILDLCRDPPAGGGSRSLGAALALVSGGTGCQKIPRVRCKPGLAGGCSEPPGTRSEMPRQAQANSSDGAGPREAAALATLLPRNRGWACRYLIAKDALQRVPTGHAVSVARGQSARGLHTKALMCEGRVE